MLVNQPWSTKPFNMYSDLEVPIFNFATGKFSGEVSVLDHENFNQILRRDIVHNVNEYFEHKGKSIWKRTKTLGDTAGSGVKPVQQKGRGAARQGNKRAPQRRKGGKAHGVVPRSLEFPINSKKRLLALKIMLSAKLYEDRLIFIESEELDYPKTQLLESILKPFSRDKLCILTPADPVNNNLDLAARNLGNVRVKKPQEFNVPDLLKNDYIFISKQGLLDFEDVIMSRHQNYFRNRKVSRPEHIANVIENRRDVFEKHIITPILTGDEEALDGYDDDKPVTILSESLKGYIEDLQRLQFEALEKQRLEQEKAKAIETDVQEAELISDD